MKVIQPGHRYGLDHLDGKGTQILQFVQRAPRPLHEGTTNQEVLRAVIDRVKFLNSEVPWDGNTQIIHHLRMAIALHESRALVRHVEKGDLAIELALLGSDGHLQFVLKQES